MQRVALDIPGLQIEEELGRGAYSTVYSARLGEQRCAVKVARRRGLTARWFRREAAALARVHHSGVPDVLDVGEISGRPYLVMEFVEGETLAERIRRDPPSPQTTLELGRRLVDIAIAVHERGLVHRDIKPANVLLQPSGVPRLVDFGLATQFHPMLGVAEAAGTRAYAAPEQLRGTQLVDARADLFAIGRVLEECIDASRDSANPALRTVIGDLVVDDPAQRYHSAAALSVDLGRIARGEDPRGAGASQPRRVGVNALPLVGRDAELGQLWDAWARTARGRGRVVVVEGPPGSGKTRLVSAIATATRERGSAPVLETSGGPSLPLAAVRSLIDRYLVHLAQLPPARRAACERQIVEAATGPAAPLLATISPRLAALLGDPEPPSAREHEAFAEATARLIVRLAKTADRMLICVDDVQWLDPLSREILVRVALEATRAPILFLAAARGDGRSLPLLQRFTRSLGRERLDVVSLRGFGSSHVEELARAYLDAKELDPALSRLLTGVSDRTPLGTFELLGALIDSGALRPHWGEWRLDPTIAEQTPLPRGAAALLDSRLSQLPPATSKVLEAAAMLGGRFDEHRVAEVVGVTVDDLGFALVDAGHAGLIELDSDGRPRFVHDSIREALLRPLSEEQRRALHQRVAESLHGEVEEDPQLLLDIADHYAAGERDKAPERVYSLARSAAERAAADLDHETASRFFDLAEDSAGRAGIRLDAAFHRGVAESRIQVGALEESLVSLERALARSDRVDGAGVLARIAWVHQMRADPDRAWETLVQAFDRLDESMPTERARAIAATLLQSGREHAARRFRGSLQEAERARLRILCDLHYQNWRLGFEYDRPLRTLQSALSILSIGERLGPSATLAGASATYGVFMTLLGRKTAGARYIDRGRKMAEELADPAAIAHITQLHSAISFLAGDVDRGFELAEQCLGVSGPWMEVSEYCHIAASARLMEGVRGRPREALRWLDRATARVRRHGRTPAAFVQLLVPGVRASLAGLGRERETDEYVGALVDASPPTRSRGLYKIGAWGPKATLLVDSGRVGEELDELVAAFEAEGHNPRRVHLSVGEYYISVAHGYAQRCLRADREPRKKALERLDRALVDLRKASRIPLFSAHYDALAGFRAMLAGDERRARKHFDAAEAVGGRETAPWVLYTVARGRAHLLQRQGKQEAARDQARVAAVLAREHGAVQRCRWVEEEFELDMTRYGPEPSTGRDRSGSSASAQRRRQLRALVDVSKATTKEHRLGPQSRVVLDELVRTVGAKRGLLLFQRALPTATRLLTGRTAEALDWSPEDPAFAALLDRVCDGDSSHAEEGATTLEAPIPADLERVIVAPLLMHDEAVGAVYLERGPGEPKFSDDEVDLIHALAPQVPATLELARMLEERERMQADLRHAQKMEAVGQLASGLAHDFNNMLTAIRSSLDVLDDIKSDDPDYEGAVGTIHNASQRATDLTRQLLTFSRRQVLDSAVFDLDAIVGDLAPLFERILGPGVVLDVRRCDAPVHVRVDQSSLEQALVNLVANARDAMVDGGTLTIAVEEVELDETWLVRGVSQMGHHALITITDTGNGMPPEILDKIFEPFFTTKEMGRGTGLGLASVYGFVQQSGGHVEVHSEAGVGSTFAVYLPTCEEAPAKRVKASLPVPRAPGEARILVVEDDALVRRSIAAALAREGYTIEVAANGRDALAYFAAQGTVDLVVTDVLMPVMGGPDLARRLTRDGIDVPVLFVSGYTDGELVQQGVLQPGVEFLHKPFAPRDLVNRVRSLLATKLE